MTKLSTLAHDSPYDPALSSLDSYEDHSSSHSLDTLEALLGPGNYKRIARECNLSSTHVSRVLRGKIGASFDTAQRISDSVGITVHDLRRYIDATKEIE